MNKKITVFITGLLIISLNIFSLFLFCKFDFLEHTNQAKLINLLWFAGITSFIVLILIHYPPEAEKIYEKSLTPGEKILFLIILFFALSIRLYKIKFNGFYLDEWYWLTEAKNILSGFTVSPFGFIGDLCSNLPAYPVALLFAIFKDCYLAVRLPGVIYSMLNLCFIFFFLKEALDKKTAFLSSLLISTSIWDIHMCHLGWNNININLFLISGLIFFTYRGLKKLSEKDILYAGIFLAICINLLYTSSVLIIPVFLYIIYEFITVIQPFPLKKIIISSGISPLSEEEKKEKLKKIITILGILIITVFIISYPTIIKIKKYPDGIKNFVSKNITIPGKDKNSDYYLEQVITAIKDFKYRQENYKKIGIWRTTIEPPLYYLFIVGLIYSIIYARIPHNFIILLAFLFIFGEIIVFNNFFAMGYGIFPIIYIMASMGVYFISKIPFEEEISKKYNLTKNFPIIIYTTAIIIYFAGWLFYFSAYRENLLINESDNYETYCKRITEHIKKDIPENTLILLPEEMGKPLISINIESHYKWDTYYNYFSIMNYLIKRKPVAIVEIVPSGYSFDFYINQLKMVKSILALEHIMRKSEPSLNITYVKTMDDGKICGTIYYLSFKKNNYSKLTGYQIPSFKHFRQDGSIKLHEPKDLAIDNNDNIYIVDRGNCKIVKLDSAGKFITSFGSEGNKKEEFQSPWGMEIDDKTGDMWIADTGNHRIKKINIHGKTMKIIEGGLYSPQDVTIDKYGNIYVCDTGNGMVKKYNSLGNLIKEWGCKTLFSDYMFPSYIKGDENGDIYVSDTGLLRIIVFSPEGSYLREFSLKPFLKYYSNEIYLFMEGKNILVSDTVNNKIMRFNKKGQLLNIVPAEKPFGIIKNSRYEIIYGDSEKKILKAIYF